MSLITIGPTQPEDIGGAEYGILAFLHRSPAPQWQAKQLWLLGSLAVPFLNSASS